VLVIDGRPEKGITLITWNDSISVTGKIENGIVAVTAYGVVDHITLPLFKVYKPKERLKALDVYRSKPQIAAQMMRELQAMGFRFKLVLGMVCMARAVVVSSMCCMSWSLILPWRFVVTMRFGYHRDKQFGAIAGVNLSVCLAMARASFATSENHLRQASRSAILGVDNWPETLPRMQLGVMTHIPNLKYQLVICMV